MLLSGRVAVITGGASGIGLGVTLDREKLRRYHELARTMQTAAQTSIVGDPHAGDHLPIVPRW